MAILKDDDALFDRYYRQKLSKRAFNQFASALRKRSDGLWETFLRPALLIDQEGTPISAACSLSDEQLVIVESLTDQSEIPNDLSHRPAYICLSGTKVLKGRSQKPLLQNLGLQTFPTGDFVDPRRGTSFFTNYLRFGIENDETWDQPSRRFICGPLLVLTVEVDPPRSWTSQKKIELLEEQMAWLRRSGNSKRSAPIWKIIEWISQFSDFRAICATYSGNKSIHFHFLFDTSELTKILGGDRHRVRTGYSEAFTRLSVAFSDLLPLRAEHDPQMRFPEQFRRLPNGTCFVSKKDNHIFGVPPGSEVPQVVLFEHVTEKAANRSKRQFFDPTELLRVAAPARKRVPNRVSSVGFRSEKERDFILEETQKLVGPLAGPNGYPKLHSVEWDGQFKAKFLADENDQNRNRPVCPLCRSLRESDNVHFR